MCEIGYYGTEYSRLSGSSLYDVAVHDLAKASAVLRLESRAIAQLGYTVFRVFCLHQLARDFISGMVYAP